MIYVINTRKNLFILELKLHFEVEKICIIVPAVDVFNDVVTPGMTIVGIKVYMLVEVVSNGKVQYVCQIGITKAGTANITENVSPISGCTTSHIPSIASFVELKKVEVSSYNHFWNGFQEQLNKEILVIHQVVKGGKGIQSSGR